MINLKDVDEDIRKIEGIAKQLKNVDLLQAVLDLKSRILDLHDDILSFAAEAQELKKKIEDKAVYNLVFDNNVYWNKLPGQKTDGPFCSVCRDRDGKLVRMLSSNLDAQGHYSPQYICPVCKNAVKR